MITFPGIHFFIFKKTVGFFEYKKVISLYLQESCDKLTQLYTKTNERRCACLWLKRYLLEIKLYVHTCLPEGKASICLINSATGVYIPRGF